MTQRYNDIPLQLRIEKLERQMEEAAKLQLETVQTMADMSDAITALTDKLAEVFAHLSKGTN